MDSLYYAGRTIGYFMGWGYVLGAIGGFMIMWLVRPLSLIGGRTSASVVGLIAGCLVGTLMAVIQALTFHREIDIVAYRRLSVLGIGLLFGITCTAVFFLIIEQETGLAFFVTLGLTFLWTSLMGAFLTHHYVMWRASLLLTESELEQIPINLLSPQNQLFKEATTLWWGTRLKFWLYGISAVVALYLVFTSSTGPQLPNWGSLTVLAPVAFLALWVIGSSAVIWFFLLFQTAPIFILKQVIFIEYQPLSPHTTRITLTFISLVWSLTLCWWMVYLVPLMIIVPLITTYYVYNTIALPDELKAKNKEKETLIAVA